MYRIGLDIGSTTIKYVVLNEKDEIVKKGYNRHMSFVTKKAKEILTEIKNEFGDECYLSFSGSAAIGLADYARVNFVQEVYSEKIACDKLAPETDIIIELGGEDAKIVFLTNGLEVRMNGSCAGGTGAFIDQMALLLDVSVEKMNDLAKKAVKTYPIASRCGVFAKNGRHHSPCCRCRLDPFDTGQTCQGDRGARDRRLWWALRPDQLRFGPVILFPHPGAWACQRRGGAGREYSGHP